jgi:hypothetical protein
LCVITIGTEEYSLAQQYVFKLIKPGYMFQLYSLYQAYLQSFVELYMLNAYAMWDPSSEAKWTLFVFLIPSVKIKKKASLMGSHTAYAFNPLTPELNPSAQRCLTRFLTGDFASLTVHFVNICVKNQKTHQLFIQFINYVW